MEIEFSDRRLQRCYEDPALAARQWGPEVARKYLLRINTLLEIQDWNSLASIRSFRLHPLTGSRSGQWAMTIHGRWRLIVTATALGVVIVEEVSNHYGD